MVWPQPIALGPTPRQCRRIRRLPPRLVAGRRPRGQPVCLRVGPGAAHHRFSRHRFSRHPFSRPRHRARRDQPRLQRALSRIWERPRRCRRRVPLPQPRWPHLTRWPSPRLPGRRRRRLPPPRWWPHLTRWPDPRAPGRPRLQSPGWLHRCFPRRWRPPPAPPLRARSVRQLRRRRPGPRRCHRCRPSARRSTRR